MRCGEKGECAVKKKHLMPIITAVTLVLELLPYGAVMNFANPEGEPFRRTFSYFSLIPFGYASFAPMITGLMTVALLVLSAVYYFKCNKKLLKAIKIGAFITLAFSASPVFMGVRYLSVVGVLITVCLFFLCLVTFMKEE